MLTRRVSGVCVSCVAQPQLLSTAGQRTGAGWPGSISSVGGDGGASTLGVSAASPSADTTSAIDDSGAQATDSAVLGTCMRLPHPMPPAALDGVLSDSDDDSEGCDCSPVSTDTECVMAVAVVVRTVDVVVVVATVDRCHLRGLAGLWKPCSTSASNRSTVTNGNQMSAKHVHIQHRVSARTTVSRRCRRH